MRGYLPLAVAAILCGIATLEIPTTARGGYVTETVSTPAGGTTTDFSLNLAVPTFNRSLGTLSGVTISFGDSATMQGWVMNTAPIMESFEVVESSTFMLSMDGTKLLFNTLGAQASCMNMPSDEVGSFGMHQASGSSAPMTMTSGSMFNAFEASTPSVNLNFSSLTSTQAIGGGGNASTGIYTTAFATVAVTYTYLSPAISVPEPSSLMLTVVGTFVVSASMLLQGSRSFRSRSS